MTWFVVVVGGLFAGIVPSVARDEKPRRPADEPKRFEPARLLMQFDKNKDGVLDRSEVPERMRARFDQMDANSDGRLSKEELAKFAPGADRRPAGPTRGGPEGLFRLLDANGDGKLSKEELANAPKLLGRLDRNKNGTLEPDELVPPARRGGGRPGEVITPAAKGERLPDKLSVGDRAPDFTLPRMNGKGEVTLSSFQGKKPVVLIFASYT